MKWLCTLLALWILTLSVQPVCTLFSVEDTCCTQSLTTSTCENEDGDDCSQTSQKDCRTGCNPFQVCACCAFTVMQPEAAWIEATQPGIVSVPQWSVHADHDYSAPEYGIWQPPQTA